MAIGLFLFIVLVVGGAIVAGSFGVAFATNRNGADAEVVRNLRSELKASRIEALTATKALRNIANGAGNPTLEASLALEEINNNDIKELN